MTSLFFKFSKVLLVASPFLQESVMKLCLTKVQALVLVSATFKVYFDAELKCGLFRKLIRLLLASPRSSLQVLPTLYLVV